MCTATILGCFFDLPNAEGEELWRVDQARGTDVRAFVNRVRVVLIIGVGDKWYSCGTSRRAVSKCEVETPDEKSTGNEYKISMYHHQVRDQDEDLTALQLRF
jgi:hypothetical protein